MKKQQSFFFLKLFAVRMEPDGRSKRNITSMTHVDIWTYFVHFNFFISAPDWLLFCFSLFWRVAFIYTKKREFESHFTDFAQVQNISMKNINIKHPLPWICQGFSRWLWYSVSFCSDFNHIIVANVTYQWRRSYRFWLNVVIFEPKSRFRMTDICVNMNSSFVLHKYRKNTCGCRVIFYYNECKATKLNKISSFFFSFGNAI